MLFCPLALQIPLSGPVVHYLLTMLLGLRRWGGGGAAGENIVLLDGFLFAILYGSENIWVPCSHCVRWIHRLIMFGLMCSLMDTNMYFRCIDVTRWPCDEMRRNFQWDHNI